MASPQDPEATADKFIETLHFHDAEGHFGSCYATSIDVNKNALLVLVLPVTSNPKEFRSRNPSHRAAGFPAVAAAITCKARVDPTLPPLYHTVVNWLFCRKDPPRLTALNHTHALSAFTSRQHSETGSLARSSKELQAQSRRGVVRLQPDAYRGRRTAEVIRRLFLACRLERKSPSYPAVTTGTATSTGTAQTSSRSREMAAVRSILSVVALAVFQLLLSDKVVQAQDGVEVHVMSFNVRTSYASEDAKSTCSNWDGVRKDNAANQIRTVAPDFVGTQETSEPQKGFLDGALASQYLSIGRYSGSLNGKAGEVNAIYYKVADWKSLGDGMFWLGPNPDAMSAAWGMDYYRTAVWGRFQHIKSGLTVCVFNTHYETPGKTEAQNQASGIILTRMATICQPTDKLTVMTGDFNAQPGESAIKKLLDGGLAEPSMAATYCGDMISPTCATKFDYTFHKLADGACYKTSEVLRTAFGGCYTSDHAPLLGTFCLEGSCCGATPAPSPSPSAGSGNTGSSAGSSAATAGSFAGSAANEENVIPGTVSAGKDSGLVGNDALVGGAPTAGGGAGTTGGSSAATPSGDGPATQASTSSSTSGSSATGTFMAVFGVVGAVALVALVVVRKKRALDSRLDSEKTAAAPMVPSYFTRDNDVGSEADLSPLPRITEQSALERQSNSPIPTLWAGEKKERDSRSSSVSYKGYSPGSQYDSRESSTNFSVRMSSAVLLDGASTYSRSPSYDARMQESRINFSEAFVADSFDSEDGGALTKSRTDFAML